MGRMLRPLSPRRQPGRGALASLAFLAVGLVTAGAETVTTLNGPGEPVAPGSTVVLEWITVNPSAMEAAFDPPRVVTGSAWSGERSWPVTLQAVSNAPATVAAGAFAFRRYEVQLPPEAVGRLVLELDRVGGPPLRAVMEVREGYVAAEESQPRPLSSLAHPAPATSAIVRTFAGRLATHEPIYFIYGPEAPAAKFSFKYRLLTFLERPEGIWPETLHFGYTQRSLWDLEGESSPFYDTSYMPEVMFESLAPMRAEDPGWFGFLGYVGGFRHESNGRDGPLSRSLNQLFIRGTFVVGPLDGWHLLVMPEVYEYVSDLSDNPDIRDYRGHGQLRLVLGRNDGPSLMATARAGRDLEHATVQLDLTVPVQTPFLDFETYFLVQYFTGYGESLLSYREKSESIRAGFSFVR
jgi:phospholipase A1